MWIKNSFGQEIWVENKDLPPEYNLKKMNSIEEFQKAMKERGQTLEGLLKIGAKDRQQNYSAVYRARRNAMVYSHYGNKCACPGCNETNPLFLTIDHIDGGGQKHRKEIKGNIYHWLIKNNFPPGFQILCMNCNIGKARNKGICPHQIKK